MILFKRFFLSVIFVAIFGILLSACGSGSDSQRTLVILHTSDEHSHLLGVGPESEDYPPAPFSAVAYLKGGIARRATVFNQLRAQAAAEGSAILTLSSGDNLMGSLAHVGEHWLVS